MPPLHAEDPERIPAQMKHRDMAVCKCPPSIDPRHEKGCPFWHHPVEHPRHYTSHPSGIECIEVTEHMNYCLGNAMKYLWRAGRKNADPIEDLRKSVYYIEREIDRLTKNQAG